MKPFLYITLLLLFVTLSLLPSEVFTPASPHTLQPIETYQHSLDPDDRSIKMVLNKEKTLAYWLSAVGELHRINQDTSQHQILHKVSLAWENVTFIEDFCLNSATGSIYFTDLMDLSSGESAIKVSDATGEELKTIASLPNEIPYQLCLSEEGDILFYLSKKEEEDSTCFALRFIQLEDQSSGTLYTSSHKLEKISINNMGNMISVIDRHQKFVSFATDTQFIHGLAEAW